MGDETPRPPLVRLMLALALTCLLGWIFKAHCDDAAWGRFVQYTSGCYSDAVPFWGLRGVAAGQLPYFQAPLEYPVLTGGLIWIDGILTHVLFGRAASAWRFLDTVTLVNALLAAFVLGRMWEAGLTRTRLWAWACAPALLLYVGHNWDMLAVALAVAAVLAAREGRLVRASATAGLGVAAKLFPIVLLPLLGLQALAQGSWRGRLRLAALVTAAAVGAWVAVNVIPAIWAAQNWSEFYRFSSERDGTAASSWAILSAQGWWLTDTAERNLYGTLIFASGFLAIVALGWRRHRDRLWVLFAPALAWFMLTNKVYSPQFDLWLYPMLLLLAPRLWPVVLFAVGGVGAYFAEFWWLAGQNGAHPSATLTDIALWAGLRALAMLVLIADGVLREPPAWLGRTAGVTAA
jgi:uncharacterized membrane protein